MTGMRTLRLAIGIAFAVLGGCERGSNPTNSTAAGGAQQSNPTNNAAAGGTQQAKPTNNADASSAQQGNPMNNAAASGAQQSNPTNHAAANSAQHGNPTNNAAANSDTGTLQTSQKPAARLTHRRFWAIRMATEAPGAPPRARAEDFTPLWAAATSFIGRERDIS